MKPNRPSEKNPLGEPTCRRGDSGSGMMEKGDSHPRGRRLRRSTPADVVPQQPQRPRRTTGRSSRRRRTLSRDAERELAERIKRGDTAARTQLILANLRLVVSIARRYRSSQIPFEDLIQEGNLGLIRASQDFDPSLHNSRFSTYAILWIKSFVHRALVANKSLIRIPEHVFLLRKRYRRAIGALGGPGLIGTGSIAAEPPSIEQVAREMGISPRKLKSSRLAAIGHGLQPKTDEEGEIVALTAALVDRRRPEDDVINHEERALLVAALRQLSPVEAWVIRERYGLHALMPDENDWAKPGRRAAPPMIGDRTPDPQADRSEAIRSRSRRTYAELERECGLSPYRIRQVERVALDKLRRILSPWLDPDI